MSEEETAVVEWLESEEGFFHACAFTENALIVGFPQLTPHLWPNFGALIIKRQPVGGEPEVVALESDNSTFKIVKRYDLTEASECVCDWSFQSLMLSLPRIVREWEEWTPFIGNLFNEALLQKAAQGQTLFGVIGHEDIEA